MILRLTELNGKSLTLVINEFALRDPLPIEQGPQAGARLTTSFGNFFVKETPAEILKMTK